MKKILVGSIGMILLAAIAFNGIAFGQNMSTTGNSTELGVGSRGQDVTTLQMFLQSKGYFTLPNKASYGYFGPMTKNALIRYQNAQELAPNGRYDASTREKVKSEMGTGNMNGMTSNTNTKAASLRVLLNSLNREHANLAAIALRNGFEGSADFEASAKALDNNSIEIGKSIGSVYGPAAEAQFLEIWRSHITFFVDYTLASKANDEVKKQKAVADLANYVNRTADFLSQANPNLPREAVHQVVTEHVRLLRSTIDKHFAGNYPASYTEQHAMDVQIGTQVADTVAGAIVKQFPSKF